MVTEEFRGGERRGREREREKEKREGRGKEDNKKNVRGIFT